MLDDVDRVCPLLGLVGDRRSAIDGVDHAHRCHAEPTPVPVDRREQSQLCLTAAHRRCARYLAYVARTGGAVPGRVPIGDGLVSTRLLLAPAPTWHGVAGRARRAPTLPLALGAGAALLLAGGAVVTAVTGGLDRDDDANATVVPVAAASASARFDPATAEPSPSPTATLRPTPSASPVPTPAPTAVPTIAATPPPATPAAVTYVVQAGDTLAAIAQRFGTTVDVLQARNGIEEADEIIIGTVLVIP
jgi:LysM repeat protein